MYDMRGCGFTALTGLTWETSFLGYEPKIIISYSSLSTMLTDTCRAQPSRYSSGRQSLPPAPPGPSGSPYLRSVLTGLRWADGLLPEGSGPPLAPDGLGEGAWAVWPLQELGR